MPISGIFGYRILPSGKIRARKAQSKKSLLDFFDKLNAAEEVPQRRFDVMALISAPCVVISGCCSGCCCSDCCSGCCSGYGFPLSCSFFVFAVVRGLSMPATARIIHDLSSGRKTRALRKPKNTAAAIPPAQAVRPPRRAPRSPSLFTASRTPLARL